MSADDILTATFAEHEGLAPDAELTLEGIHRRAHGRRTATRSLTVAGTVATVAAVVLGASLVGTHGQPRPGPTSRGPAAGGQSGSPTGPPPVAAAPDAVTIAAGWLPPGRIQQVGMSNGFGHQLRSYALAAGGPVTSVIVALAPGSALPTSSKRGTPRDLTVAGQPAREWSVDDWYYLAIRLRAGGIATVDVEGGDGKGHDGTAAALADAGRRIGVHLRLDRHDRIPVAYRLGVVPAGLAVRDVSWMSASGTIYTLAPPAARWQDTMPSYPTVSELRGDITSYRNSYGRKRMPTITAGRQVLGHRTYLVDRGPASTELFVDSVRPGWSIVLTGAGVITDTGTLYRIADGLRLG